MQLYLYQLSGDNRILDKTSYLTLLFEFNGQLTEASSIINPKILLSDDETFDVVGIESGNEFDVLADDSDVVISSYNAISKANYAYIPEFERYYFINDIVSVANGLWMISMSCDVLYSFKDEILDLRPFVTRNEYSFDSFVKDDLISYYYDKRVTEYIPSKSDKVNTTFRTTHPLGVEYTNFVLSVINDQIWSTGDSITSPDSSLPEVDSVCGQGQTKALYVCTALNITRLARALTDENYSNLYSFVSSVIALPFLVQHDSTELYLRLGKTYIDGLAGVHCYKIANKVSQYYVIADFTINSYSFRDYEPYTQYQIWIPYLSWVDVSADDILNNRIIVYYVVNYETGSSQVTIYDVTNGKNIFTSNCQLGMKIGLSSTNARDVKDNETSNNIGLAVGLLTSALAIAGGAASGNAIAVGGGLLSGGKTIANYVQNQNTNYLRASGNLSDANAGLYSCQDVKIRTTKLKPKDYNANFAKHFGKPLNAYRDLRHLSGFTQCGDVILSGFENATESEKMNIISLLKQGIII